MLKFDSIAILGGGLIKDKQGWRTTNYNEGDGFGIIGDRLRVVAGYYLYKAGVGKLFIASGGKGLYKEKDAPLIADVLRKEMVEFGVPENIIITENKSINSYQQLTGLKAILSAKKISTLGIVSNDWHLPRIKALLDYAPKLKDMAPKVVLLPAEKILIENNPKVWEKTIKKAKRSVGLRKRVLLEQEGIFQIKNGQYKFK